MSSFIIRLLAQGRDEKDWNFVDGGEYRREDFALEKAIRSSSTAPTLANDRFGNARAFVQGLRPHAGSTVAKFSS
jgi:hypothetical protein